MTEACQILTDLSARGVKLESNQIMTESRRYPDSAMGCAKVGQWLTIGRRRHRTSGQRPRRRHNRLLGLAAVMLACVLPIMATSACWIWGWNWGGIKVSGNPQRGNANALASARCTGDVYIFFDGAQVTEVTYYLDDYRGQHAPYSVDRTAPFDLAGTTDNGTAKPFRTSTMANGTHTVLAVVGGKGGSRAPYVSTFVISNNVAAAPKATAAAAKTTADATPTTTLSGLPWRSGATDTGDAFASWRGRPLDVATTFENDGTWKGTEVVWALETGELANFRGKLSIAVPMLSDHNDTFPQCAAGAYDSHFRALGTTLKKYGRENSYIRLGWEGNGTWMAWSANGDVAGWKACFRREVQALRSVAPGVQIDWNMNKDGATSAVDLYPGDDVVDVVGVDYYSMYPSLNKKADWDSTYIKRRNDSPVGIGAWLAFAKSHGKKLSVPEWGVNHGGGGGDDSAYVQYMYNFFTANAAQIAYEAYFNSQCPNFCILPAGKNPLAVATYRQLWGGW